MLFLSTEMLTRYVAVHVLNGKLFTATTKYLHSYCNETADFTILIQYNRDDTPKVHSIDFTLPDSCCFFLLDLKEDGKTSCLNWTWFNFSLRKNIYPDLYDITSLGELSTADMTSTIALDLLEWMPPFFLCVVFCGLISLAWKFFFCVIICSSE